MKLTRMACKEIAEDRFIHLSKMLNAFSVASMHAVVLPQHIVIDETMIVSEGRFQEKHNYDVGKYEPG